MKPITFCTDEHFTHSSVFGMISNLSTGIGFWQCLQTRMLPPAYDSSSVVRNDSQPLRESGNFLPADIFEI